MKTIRLLILLTICAVAFGFAATSDVLTQPTPDTATSAAVVDPALVASSDGGGALISALAVKFPWLVTVFAIMGAARAVMKPIVTGLEAAVKATPTTADDAIFEKVEHSKAWRLFAWGLDYFGSVKVGPQFTARPSVSSKNAAQPPTSTS